MFRKKEIIKYVDDTPYLLTRIENQDVKIQELTEKYDNLVNEMVWYKASIEKSIREIKMAKVYKIVPSTPSPK